MAVSETFTYATINSTPELVWMIMALVAVAFFIIAFSHKLRDEDGSISTVRVAFSLFGSVICAIVAYLSLVIDVNTGSQTHALYQSPVIAIIFVIFSIILFANFVYSIIAPEMIKPSKDDYHFKSEGDKK